MRAFDPVGKFPKSCFAEVSAISNREVWPSNVDILWELSIKITASMGPLPKRERVEGLAKASAARIKIVMRIRSRIKSRSLIFLLVSLRLLRRNSMGAQRTTVGLLLRNKCKATGIPAVKAPKSIHGTRKCIVNLYWIFATRFFISLRASILSNSSSGGLSDLISKWVA